MSETRISNGEMARRDWSEAQRTAALQELHRILDHKTFKSSRQCAALLRYLVERLLGGQLDGIKERTLGIEVFGRNPDYDTNTDPIVRRTASEIRKRLAQYYQEPESRGTIKINMVRGSYLPEFEFESTEEVPAAVNSTLSESSPNLSKQHWLGGGSSERSPNRWRSHLILGIAALLLLSSVGYLIAIRLDTFQSPEYRVWKPLLTSGDWVLVCLSDAAHQMESSTGMNQSEAINNIASSPQTPPVSGSQQVPPSIPFIDAHVGHAITTRLLEFKRQTRLQTSSQLTIQDFRQRSTVIIGGTNNPWALILLNNLRFSIRVDLATNDKWIQDAQHPSKRDWKIDGKQQNYAAVPYDYAVITRIFDSGTSQWVMALSGLEGFGTEAAGELVADPAFAKFIPASIRSTGNFQIVLKTSVLRGNTGPIEILAVHTW